ncbi:MAG: winged helix-turn-helix domain-containing protein, partial [Woeseiaceae bacterium]
LSSAEARRVALAAQGFDRQRPKSAGDARHIRRVINQIGVLQLDYVNVLIPAHYLVLYSRLGAYPRQRLNDLVYRRREFIEQRAHELSIVPMDAWPLLKHRRDEYQPYPHSPIMKLPGRKEYLRRVLRIVEARGPVTADDLPPLPRPEFKAGDWYRSVPRWALELHFCFGSIAVADRLPNFQRVYDVPERVIDATHLEDSVARDEAQRALLRRAVRACGISTVRDMADYFRMPVKEAVPRVKELVEEGTLREVRVDDWNEPGYLSRDAVVPRGIRASALLSPFDPVVWFRPRAERLFDFHYRIEIYVPANKRKWGYYVLPYLLDDRIVARVDLKADRKEKRLLVLAAHEEAGIDRIRTINKLAQELAELAAWLDLESVRVARRGSFARLLADAVRGQP